LVLTLPRFAGKEEPFPEKGVNAPVEGRTLAFVRGNQQQVGERRMERNRTSKRNRKAMLGNALLMIGSVVLVTYSAALAWQFHSALNNSAVESLGIFGSLGLASLHAARVVAFDHAAILSVVRHILILFSAFLAMLIGIALLPRRAAGLNAPGTRNLSAPPKGDQ
jgi:hypothetical protein